MSQRTSSVKPGQCFTAKFKISSYFEQQQNNYCQYSIRTNMAVFHYFQHSLAAAGRKTPSAASIKPSHQPAGNNDLGQQQSVTRKKRRFDIKQAIVYGCQSDPITKTYRKYGTLREKSSSRQSVRFEKRTRVKNSKQVINHACMPPHLYSSL